jgi:GT2 family glycosyltransferase
LRREAIEQVGPLDESFAPAWFEDVDYCQRFARAGKEIWVVPAAQARHFGGSSLEHVGFAGFVDVWYRNMWRYASKWLSPAHSETLRWVIVLGMMLRCAAAMAGLKPKGVRRGTACRVYARVMRKALGRWSGSHH